MYYRFWLIYLLDSTIKDEGIEKYLFDRFDCRYWRIPSSEFRFCIEGAGPSSTESLGLLVVFSSVSVGN